MTSPSERFLRAVILDVEGVVIDTEPAWDEVQRQFLARRGRDYIRHELKPLLTGRSIDESSLLIKTTFDLEEPVQRITEERVDLMQAQLAKGMTYLAGFLEFFEHIDDEFSVAMATSLDADLLEVIDGTLHVSELVEGKVATVADVGGRGKPAPDIFLFAAGLVHQPPERCLAIEDSPSGVAAALSASMMTVGIATTHPSGLLSHADLVVAGFEELDVDVVDRMAWQKATHGSGLSGDVGLPGTP
jgi:beta-phosphoglucomutase-like phosphatase (HAD superfamily)